MITMEGAVFGKLVVNSTCLSFKSEPRKDARKPRFGSASFIQIAKEVNKKWKLTEIREVVVKRYNLIRQAIEIYFSNSKSVFFSLYGKGYLNGFVRQLETIVGKNKLLNIELVLRPEQYFERKKYKEAWINGDLSNFAYLMLLNKYGGRSFNDLNQYPIFPWVISNYDDPELDITDPKNYRELNWPIGAITPEKRKRISDKFEMLSAEQGLDPYQIGTHCLPGRIVLGYMFRVEPFSTILIQFERGRDSPSRMFHVFSRAWLSGTIDLTDNKELVPEFYYLPEILHNHNNYSYGIKLPDDDLLEIVGNPYVKVRIDGVLLPNWAKNAHHFVQTNATALESRQTSMGLDKWIDLLFGEKQQDKDACNMYKNLCDEEFVSRNLENLSESNVVEIQEFGSNPVRIFNAKHPPKNQKAIDIRTQYGIFKNLLIFHKLSPDSNEESSCVFALMKIKLFRNEAITFLKAYEQRVHVVLHSQKLVRSKDEYVNALHEKPVHFESKELKLYPYKPVYLPKSMSFIGDPRRMFDFFDKGTLIITCRHYDNTFKISSTATGEQLVQITFHNVCSLITPSPK